MMLTVSQCRFLFLLSTFWRHFPLLCKSAPHASHRRCVLTYGQSIDRIFRSFMDTLQRINCTGRVLISSNSCSSLICLTQMGLILTVTGSAYYDVDCITVQIFIFSLNVLEALPSVVQICTSRSIQNECLCSEIHYDRSNILFSWLFCVILLILEQPWCP